MGHPHIPEVPGLGPDAGDRLLFLGIPLDKAVVGRQRPEPAADAVPREGRADRVDDVGGQGQVHGQAGLVLAAARAGHIPGGEVGAVGLQRPVPDGLLLPPAAPAGHRQDHPRPAGSPDALGQHPGRRAVQVLVGPAAGQRHQVGHKGAAQWVVPVDQHQRALPGFGPGQPHRGGHPCTPWAISRSSRLGKSSPAARIMLGKRLCPVRPGMVFTSLSRISPAGVRNRSTRAKPRQPSAR